MTEHSTPLLAVLGCVLFPVLMIGIVGALIWSSRYWNSNKQKGDSQNSAMLAHNLRTTQAALEAWRQRAEKADNEVKSLRARIALADDIIKSLGYMSMEQAQFLWSTEKGKK